MSAPILIRDVVRPDLSGQHAEMRKFWTTRIWPADPHGYVFLARALEAIGRARFGQEWTGTEFVIDPDPVLGGDLTGVLGDRLRARKLLQKHRPDIQLQPARLAGPHPNVPLTQEQWSLARELSQRELEPYRSGLRRRAAVEAEFVQKCEAGQLTSAYRLTDGGQMHPVPAIWWNTERTHDRFVMCQLNPRQPFARGFAGDGYAWIYLKRDSLDYYLAAQPYAQLPASIEGHLSPYLRLMLSVSRALQITSDNQPKKEVVMSELRKNWTGTIPLSDKLVDSMATLLREPESQRGRARLKKND